MPKKKSKIFKSIAEVCAEYFPDYCKLPKPDKQDWRKKDGK